MTGNPRPNSPLAIHVRSSEQIRQSEAGLRSLYAGTAETVWLRLSECGNCRLGGGHPSQALKERNVPERMPIFSHQRAALAPVRENVGLDAKPAWYSFRDGERFPRPLALRGTSLRARAA
jgi:hypothetical protein